jgi:hypothetical protein
VDWWRWGRHGERRRAARAAVGTGQREEERNIEKESGCRFKRLIFGDQGLAAENKLLFSAAVSVAAENKLIFGGYVSDRCWGPSSFEGPKKRD